MPTNVRCVHPSSHGTHRSDSPFPAILWSASQVWSPQQRQFCSSNQVCSRVVVALCPSCNPKGSSHKRLKKHCLTRSMLSSDTRGRPAPFPLQRHPVVWNCWYQRLMLLGGGSLLNFRRNARCIETTNSCIANCSTQNAFCSRVAITALLRHRPREKWGVGLRMRTKLEHLLFRSMWETY